MKLALALLLAAAAAPAAAIPFIATVGVQAYKGAGGNPYATQLYYDVESSGITAVSTTRSTGDGYAAALSSPLQGGTLSSSAYAATEAHFANADYGYNVQLSAPATASAKVRIAFSGTVSSWGNGLADAYVTAYDYNDPRYLESDFLSYDPTGKAHLRSFKTALTFVIHGGEVVPIALSTGASVNNANFFTTTAVGSAMAYLDPTVTIGSVPEPGSWAMLLAGFGLVGGIARRRRPSAPTMAAARA